MVTQDHAVLHHCDRVLEMADGMLGDHASTVVLNSCDRGIREEGPMNVQSLEPRRVRERDLDLVVGTGDVGTTNSIVDVPGVPVGHTTVSDVRSTFSGATAVVVDGVSPSNPTTAGAF